MKRLFQFILFVFSLNCYAVHKLVLPDLGSSTKVTVHGSILLPKNHKLNQSAPSQITVLEMKNSQWKEVYRKNLNQIFSLSQELPFTFDVSTSEPNSQIKIMASVYHCDKVESMYCVIDDYEGISKRATSATTKSLSLKLLGSLPNI